MIIIGLTYYLPFIFLNNYFFIVYFIYFRVNAQQWMDENPDKHSKLQNFTTQTSTYNNATETESSSSQPLIQNLFIELVRYNDHALTIYSCLVLLTIIVTMTRSLRFFRYCNSASTTLHNEMFKKIVFSPMLFFNTNPSGRILNRFSKDIGNVDEILPVTMIDTVQVKFFYGHIFQYNNIKISLKDYIFKD